MKSAYLGILAILLIILSSYSVYAVDILDVPVVEDTWVAGATGSFSVCGNASLVLDPSTNYNGQNYLLSFSQSGFTDVRAVMRFNISDLVQNRVIENANFEVVKTETAEATLAQRILLWFDNDTWNANTLTYNTMPISAFEYLRPAGFLPIGTEGSSLNLINYSESCGCGMVSTLPSVTLNRLYNSNNITFSTIQTAYTTGTDSAQSSTQRMCFASQESGAGANLRFSLSDFMTREYAYTDLGNQYIYFDFESGRASLTTFADYDVRINPALKLLESTVSNLGYYDPTDITENNLQEVSCGVVPQFYLSIIRSIDVNDRYERLFCFNLTGEHSGRKFYGAIKIYNADNTRGTSSEDLDFYWAIYSPSYSQVSSPLYFDENDNSMTPTINRSLGIYWVTEQYFTTNMTYRYKRAGEINFGAYKFLNNESMGIGSIHRVWIPASDMIAGDYEFYFFGNNANETYLSRTFTFSTITQPVLPNETVPTQLTSGINFLTVERSQLIPVEAVVYLKNSTGTTRYGTTTFVSNSSFPYGFYYFITFQNQPIGSYEVRVEASNYLNYTANITVNSLPYVSYIYLDRIATCSEYIHASTEEQCTLDAQNNYNYLRLQGYNVTSWYCQWDANWCSAYQGSTCTAYGAWQSFVCFSGRLPPSGIVNGTVGSGSATGTPNVIEPISNVLASLLGVNIEQALIFFSMILSIIVAGFVGIKSKNGMITVVLFLGLMIMFTGMGWFPILYMIILGLISAFIIARMLTQGLIGGQ